MPEFFEIQNYYMKMKDERLQCKLCPHECIISPMRTGICKTRVNISGKFYSFVYGRPIAMHVDPMEKKPLFHFYPGEQIFSFGTAGCNLFCEGCQNYDITRIDPKNGTEDLKYISAQEIIDIALKNNTRMIAYTYNEPTVFFEYMLEVAKLAMKNNIKNVMVSNGYINMAPLKELLKYMDAVNIDIKGFTKEFYVSYTRSKLDSVMKTIEFIVINNKTSKHKTWIELTNLIIPGRNDGYEDIDALTKWIAGLDVNIPLHFSRFFPYYKANEIRMTPIETIMKAKEIAQNNGLKYVYTGNLGVQENTACNKCGSILIERSGYHTTIRDMKGNTCIKCSSEVAGVFA